MDHGIVPSALKKGDTIAFIFPSVRLNSIFPAALEQAKVSLQELGYKVKIIFDESIPFPFRREAAIKRCEEVQAAFRDLEVKAIICTAGGLHANEPLPYLDHELIKANPKIFVGYSDITLLHYAIFTQTGLRTFYGPAAITELGEFPNPLQFTLNHLSFTSLHQINPVKQPGQYPGHQNATGLSPNFFKIPTAPKLERWSQHRDGSGSEVERLVGGFLAAA